MQTDTVYLFLADTVLFSHVLVVMFVVLSVPVILLGRLRAWSWVRNPWYRGLHLLSIAVVASQAWAGVVCPLTTLEMWLREKAGEATYTGSFISHWLDKLLYYDLPAWVFTPIYSAFAGLVVLCWVWVRPRAFGNMAVQ